MKPRPNLLWHNIENQIFVDPSRYYPADDTFDEGNGNSSEEIEDYDEDQDSLSDLTTGNEDATTLEKAAEAEDEARVATAMGTTASKEGHEHSRAAIRKFETKLEDSTVVRFLDVVQDHDSHYAPVERLRNFLDGASLEQLRKDGKATERRRGCQTVLDGRNFTSRQYRHYARPLDPVKVYEKLLEKVRFSRPHILSRSWLTYQRRDSLKHALQVSVDL
jgi:hypothetical protein